MKNIKTIVATMSLMGLLAVPMISLAATIPDSGSTFETPGDLITKIEDIGNWIFTALLVLAAIFMVVAGFYFVTGGGEPEKLTKARQMLINALIGVAVGLASKGLIAVVTSLVKG